MHQSRKADNRRRVRSLRHAAGGVALTAVALAAGAAPASAATTCSYNPTTRAVTLTADTGPTPTQLITSGGVIRFTAGTLGASCEGGGVLATTSNTEKITVKGTVPTG